jgi:hypothetical protein
MTMSAPVLAVPVETAAARDRLHIEADVRALVGATVQVARGWRALVRRQLAQQPYSTLAYAAAVGFVLGGGVPAPVARTLIGIGGRLIAERALASLATHRTTG